MIIPNRNKKATVIIKGDSIIVSIKLAQQNILQQEAPRFPKFYKNNKNIAIGESNESKGTDKVMSDKKIIEPIIVKRIKARNLKISKGTKNILPLIVSGFLILRRNRRVFSYLSAY